MQYSSTPTDKDNAMCDNSSDYSSRFCSSFQNSDGNPSRSSSSNSCCSLDMSIAATEVSDSSYLETESVASIFTPMDDLFQDDQVSVVSCAMEVSSHCHKKYSKIRTHRSLWQQVFQWLLLFVVPHSLCDPVAMPFVRRRPAFIAKLSSPASNFPSRHRRVNIRQGHSHNDYHQADPLSSALKHGLNSIEVDVFPRKEGLLVAHTIFELNENKTIDSLYIQPILKLLKKGGWITHKEQDRLNGHFSVEQRQDKKSFAAIDLLNPKTDALTLLIDFKGDPERSVVLLKKALAPLVPYLSKVTTQGRFIQGKVTVLLSGCRPKESSLSSSSSRFLFLDGREQDIHTNTDSQLVPLVSLPWRNFYLARALGRGEESMKVLSEKAHAQGKLLRIWGAPNSESMWTTMLDGDIDILSIDDHERFAQFVKASSSSFTNR